MRREKVAILALVGFLWTGSGLFGAMEEAFGVVFQTPTRPFLKQKLMAVAMMGLFAVLALLAVGTSALLPLLSDIPGIPISLTKGPTGYVVQVAAESGIAAPVNSAVIRAVHELEEGTLEQAPEILETIQSRVAAAGGGAI